MDEPFSALDPLIRTKLQDELLTLQAEVKKTILFVSHDLDEALKLGNSISIMEGGRIVQTGTPEDIVLRPSNAYVAEFVQHMNPLNVLKGGTVMRPGAALQADGGSLLLDGDGKYAVTLDSAGGLQSARCGRAEVPVLRLDSFDPANAALPAGMALVPRDMPLRMVVQLRQASGHPVLLHDEGRFVGVCDDAEMLRALSGVTRAAV